MSESSEIRSEAEAGTVRRMLDTEKLSSVYDVRRLDDSDAEMILGLCLTNDQYYRYCGRQPSLELILNDLHVTPPDTPESSKYYVGFFGGGRLAAVMDLIDGYPDSETVFIGFFMVSKELQGRSVGSGIIGEVCGYVRQKGMTRMMLGIDKDNPQSNRFWTKNGFRVIAEVQQEEGAVLVAEKDL